MESLSARARALRRDRAPQRRRDAASHGPRLRRPSRIWSKAARFWAEPPTSPFAHNEELTIALVVEVRVAARAAFATDAIRRTAPWPRPTAHALHGWRRPASEGRLGETIGVLRERRPSYRLGRCSAPVFRAPGREPLPGRSAAAMILDAALAMESRAPIDPRYSGRNRACAAIAIARLEGCRGGCLERARGAGRCRVRGASWLQRWSGSVKIGALALEHRASRPKRDAWIALSQALSDGFLEADKVVGAPVRAHAQLALDLPSGAAPTSRRTSRMGS